MDRDKPRLLTPVEMAILSPEERDEEIAGLRAGELRRLKIIRQRELAERPSIRTPKEYAEFLAGEKLKRPKRHSKMTEIFYVDETNKIAAFPPREINSRRELFAIEDITDPQELVEYAVGCYPLAGFVESLYYDLEKALKDLFRDSLNSPEHGKDLDELSYGEPADLLKLTDQYFLLDDQIAAAANSWLNESPATEDWEHADHDVDGYAMAFAFFQDDQFAEHLGICCIEGLRPGDNTKAAFLETSIEEANAVALKLGLPYSFKLLE